MRIIIENRIKELLGKKKKKSNDLANHLGISKAMVSRYCTQESMPRLNMLPKIAEFLEVRPLELLVEVEVD